MIYLGADHRGFYFKEKIKDWLREWKFEFVDMGAFDYPIYAEAVAKKIQESALNFGVLICGSGVGVDIVANKFDKVRASIGKSADQVRAGRRDDNMNVLVIAADFTGEQEAIDMLQAFLKTKFDDKLRHKRRLNEIEEIEKNN